MQPEQIKIENGEINNIRQQLQQLRNEAAESGKKVPELQGKGQMATAVLQMAEAYAALEESIVGLIDNTLVFIDSTSTKFATVEQRAIERLDGIS